MELIIHTASVQEFLYNRKQLLLTTQGEERLFNGIEILTSTGQVFQEIGRNQRLLLHIYQAYNYVPMLWCRKLHAKHHAIHKYIVLLVCLWVETIILKIPSPFKKRRRDQSSWIKIIVYNIQCMSFIQYINV